MAADADARESAETLFVEIAVDDSTQLQPGVKFETVTLVLLFGTLGVAGLCAAGLYHLEPGLAKVGAAVALLLLGCSTLVRPRPPRHAAAPAPPPPADPASIPRGRVPPPSLQVWMGSIPLNDVSIVDIWWGVNYAVQAWFVAIVYAPGGAPRPSCPPPRAPTLS
jgi:hypothetical protein